jgi:Tol biopolymer transport system component
VVARRAANRIQTLQPRHDRSAIAVVSAAGGRVRRLTGDSLFATQPDWSPSGERIAFAARELTGK